MIVYLNDKFQQREARLKFFKDDVFVIANEAVRNRLGNLSIFEVFSSAEAFAFHLLNNEIAEASYIEYEVEDLESELKDGRDRFLVLSIAFIKLCALRKRYPIARKIAREIVVFCQKYEDFNGLLGEFDKKEHKLHMEEWRANLASYEFRTIVKEKPDFTQAKTAVRALIDNCMNMTGDFLERVLGPLMSINEMYGHAFDEEVKRVKDKLGMKTTVQFSPHMDGDLVMTKTIQYQVNGVATGGTGIVLDKQSNGNRRIN